MGPLAVVDPQPGVGQRPQLRDRLDEMRVEDLGAIAAVEPLDVRVLIRLARLDIVDRHAVGRAPIDEGLRREFRAQRQLSPQTFEGEQVIDDLVTRFGGTILPVG